MKNQTNKRFVNLKQKIKQKMIEKLISIKKNVARIKKNIDQTKQNIKIKKTIENRFRQMKEKSELDKNDLHKKIDNFAIEEQNNVVIARNDRLRRFHEKINHIRVLKLIFDSNLRR